MAKYLIPLAIVVLLICVGLSGCTEQTNNKDNNTISEYDRFVGSWKNETNYLETLSITFFSDGECSYSVLGGYWELKDGKCVITLYQQGLKFVYDYYFSGDYQTLYLKSSSSDTYYDYIKQ